MGAPPAGWVQACTKRLQRPCRPAPIPLALRAEWLQALYQEPAHYLSASAQKKHGGLAHRVPTHPPFLKSVGSLFIGYRTDLGGCPAPLAPLHRAGLWRCLRRSRAFICLRAVVAVPSSSVCLSSSGRLCVLFGRGI